MKKYCKIKTIHKNCNIYNHLIKTFNFPSKNADSSTILLEKALLNILIILALAIGCTSRFEMRAKKTVVNSGHVMESHLIFRDYFCHFRTLVEKSAECEKELITVDADLFRDNLQTLDDHNKRLVAHTPESFYASS